MPPTQHKREWWPIAISVVVVLLTAAVITFGSFKVPIDTEQRNAYPIFFALTTIIGASLLIFALILGRYLLKLSAERRSGQLGSRFKVKMVLGAMGLSLLPVVFLFFFSYALINRTLNLWFPRPLEIANEQSQTLLSRLEVSQFEHLNRLASVASANGSADTSFLTRTQAVDTWWIEDLSGRVISIADAGAPSASQPIPSASPELMPPTRSGAQVWKLSGQLYLAGSAPVTGGTLYVARRLPDDFANLDADIETQTNTYLRLKQQLRAYKRILVLVLAFITMVLLFVTTWVALFLSKQVTVPIQALAEATREISRGNFDQRIDVQAQDELGTLVRSFNRMTEQLGEGRRQINEFTKSLEIAVEERERRRKLMEAILENVPTGVVSLDASGDVSRINRAVVQILGESARDARTLSDLLGDEAARAVLHLMRRSLRMGAASREIEIAAAGRLVRAAVTVSSLGPRRSNPGFVIVIDDLTELLQAQKTAAWQEVAQRIAHEIKNPLTPIQLSAQRLLRYLDRAAKPYSHASGPEFEKLVAECAGLIEQESQTLSSLVSEFSQFARFPAARLEPMGVNPIVEAALGLFENRLDGITVTTDLAASLPTVRADAELMRQVIANLIDNAADAMEGAAIRRLHVATRAVSDGDAVEIEVSDSGHGISPEDKEKLFLPHFSTKGRGTGLGLAIASRIIAEHNGTIRVEDNAPVGSRFVMRFPAVEVAVSTQAG
ncbi:MAG TPA: ATP-binding protein [Candidatus Acidoferrales bacterium]|nr:ATP-binding protein [Candidatus Acidoferrales bacterium]